MRRQDIPRSPLDPLQHIRRATVATNSPNNADLLYLDIIEAHLISSYRVSSTEVHVHTLLHILYFSLDLLYLILSCHNAPEKQPRLVQNVDDALLRRLAVQQLFSCFVVVPQNHHSVYKWKMQSAATVPKIPIPFGPMRTIHACLKHFGP